MAYSFLSIIVGVIVVQIYIMKRTEYSMHFNFFVFLGLLFVRTKRKKK
jgi:hypothetical protein